MGSVIFVALAMKRHRKGQDFDINNITTSTTEKRLD